MTWYGHDVCASAAGHYSRKLSYPIEYADLYQSAAECVLTHPDLEPKAAAYRGAFLWIRKTLGKKDFARYAVPSDVFPGDPVMLVQTPVAFNEEKAEACVRLADAERRARERKAKRVQIAVRKREAKPAPRLRFKWLP